MIKNHLIADHMTSSPHTIDADSPLGLAQRILRDNNIRHLPVVKNGNLVGILSDRNVKTALASAGGETFLVADAMMPDVFTVPANTDLTVVLDEMAEEKYGSVVVQDEDGKLAGIFTTVDACRLLSHLLQQQK